MSQVYITSNNGVSQATKCLTDTFNILSPGFNYIKPNFCQKKAESLIYIVVSLFDAVVMKTVGVIYLIGGNAPSVICGDVSGQHGMSVFFTSKIDYFKNKT